MKISFECSECQKENIEFIEAGYFVLKRRSKIEKEITIDRKYEILCEKGHKETIIINIQKFQLLFDMGVKFLEDECPKEAVFNFATSIERFYEFFIFLIMCEKMSEKDNKNGKIHEMWKEISKQTERQKGLFIGLYTLIIGDNDFIKFEKTKICGKPTIVEFRNNVVHKGEIPLQKYAKEYEKIIYDFIADTLQKLRQKGIDVVKFNKNEWRERLGDAKKKTVISYPTVIELAPEEKKSIIDRKEVYLNYINKLYKND